MSTDHDAANRALAEKLLYAVGVFGIVCLAAGAAWLWHAGIFGHWLGIVIAVLVAAGLASIRIGVLGLGLVATALAALFFGPIGLLAGLLLIIALLLSARK
ncbi:hypothetical protein [Mesorhizobium sp.]|uniref:hypothetical protein n=1 Tax=Mesorhizobium sp. TaxID=1871066 RepID=UPI001228BD8B|nr:hypothetical protein [Mesorhizobium sp.]TIV59100.1 MAG: hypothetical protein E5V80_15490 [Mesorhizobium sp.]